MNFLFRFSEISVEISIGAPWPVTGFYYFFDVIAVFCFLFLVMHLCKVDFSKCHIRNGDLGLTL